MTNSIDYIYNYNNLCFSQIEETTDLRSKGKLFRKRRKIEAILPKYEDAITSCTYEQSDLDCNNYDYYPDSDSDYVDLSGLARADADTM